jgi:predicted RND superfamily exporter protein
MMPPLLRIRHRYPLQAGFVAFITTVCVLITDAFAFRSPANSIWMMGLPVGVAMVANTGWDRRCFMAMVLLGISLVVATIIGVNFTSYG